MQLSEGEIQEERRIRTVQIQEERRIRTVAARRASYHVALKRKYQWAVWFAWIRLAPDPPEP